MATSISQKLKIRENDTLLVLNPPPDFRKKIGELPGKTTIVTEGKNYDQVHWFVKTKAQLEKEMSKVMKLVKEGVIVWVYYPKGTSGIQTDLTRDKGWDCLLAESDRLTWINLISFDETWSVFGFRAKTGADKKRESKPVAGREIFKWIDPSTKEVRLPDDVSRVFRKNKKEADYFSALSFTNKKEYLEWILTAKRPETRKERIEGTIERLGKGWKNPSNR